MTDRNQTRPGAPVSDNMDSGGSVAPATTPRSLPTYPWRCTATDACDSAAEGAPCASDSEAGPECAASCDAFRPAPSCPDCRAGGCTPDSCDCHDLHPLTPAERAQRAVRALERAARAAEERQSMARRARIRQVARRAGRAAKQAGRP